MAGKWTGNIFQRLDFEWLQVLYIMVPAWIQKTFVYHLWFVHYYLKSALLRFYYYSSFLSSFSCFSLDYVLCSFYPFLKLNVLILLYLFLLLLFPLFPFLFFSLMQLEIITYYVVYSKLLKNTETRVLFHFLHSTLDGGNPGCKL